MFAIECSKLGVRFMLRHQKTDTLLETFINFLTGKTGKMFLAKSWNEAFWPLKGVSFSVNQGESYGIIGRNGAGKSTLLQVLAGIYKPDEGSIKTRGDVGLLQIWAGFHGDLTGRENIYLNGAVMGLKKDEIASLYDDIVEFSELERFINTPIKNYSSGMRARLGFSVAINVKPDILLIDEVLSVGDQRFKEKCREELDKIEILGKTIVLVSHSLRDIREICDRAICLDNGRVVFEGTSEETVDFYTKYLDKAK